MKLQVGVKILLKSGNGTFLVLKRNPQKYTDIKNLWDAPGGRIEVGSNLINNLKREVIEETGFVFKETPQLIDAQDIIIPGHKHIVRLTYMLDIDKEFKPTLSDENTDHKWLNIKELLEFKMLDKYLKHAINNLNK